MYWNARQKKLYIDSWVLEQLGSPGRTLLLSCTLKRFMIIPCSHDGYKINKNRISIGHDYAMSLQLQQGTYYFEFFQSRNTVMCWPSVCKVL